MLAGPGPIPVAAGPVFVDDEAAFRPADIDEMQPIDYRYYRYSRIAIPLLILMLLWFITLLWLTLWQGDFSIQKITGGIPRDLETPRDDISVPEGVQGIRIASAVIALSAALLAALVLCSPCKSKLVRLACFFIAFLLIICGILSIITFALDVARTSEERVVECKTQFGAPNRAQYCQAREELITVCAALDACLATLCFVLAIMLVMFSKRLHRRRVAVAEEIARERALDDPAFIARDNIVPSIPGQPRVYKTLVFIAFFALVAVACLMILFTILIHELRERVTGRLVDPEHQQFESGWAKQNSRLRVTATTVGIILVLLSLLPYAHRVYAYLIGLGFLANCIFLFVIFALDVSDLERAKDLGCPAGLICKYEPYVVVCIFDFLGAFFMAIYVLAEFGAHRRKSYVQAREYSAVDVIDDYDLTGGVFLGAAGDPFGGKFAPGLAPKRGVVGGLRPLIGVEVVEMEHPVTGELSVSIISVAGGSAAEEAGLRVGDIISRWNQMPVHTKADFAAAVRESPINSTAVLQVLRQGPGGFGTSVDYCRLVVRGVPT